MFPHAALALSFLFTKPAPPPPLKDQPVARYTIPLALPVGQKAKIVIRGAKLDTATEVKADAGTVKVTRKGKVAAPNNYPVEKIGDSEVEVEIELPADFKGEALKFTVVTPAGTSESLTVPLGKGAVAEKEPNDAFDKAQELTLPATVDATISRERDTDVFKVVGKKGQKLSIAVSSHGSPADLLFSVYDANRQLMMTVDDVGGKPDPSGELTLPLDGMFYLSVIEAHDLGGTGFAYRLTIK